VDGFRTDRAVKRGPLRPGVDFDDFVRSHGTSLVRAAFLLTGDYGHAEDLVQLTLLRLADHWNAAHDSPHAYAHRTLINLSRNRWRDLSRRPQVARSFSDDDEVESPAHHTEDVLERDALTTALSKLPDQQREIAVLRFVLDLSVADTAALLGMPEGTVKSGTSRALADLRHHLSDPELGPKEAHRAD
jgi:RNA polymerase sigma-70 factor (sigma-E family)